jgi:hypothetical protein
MNRENDLFFLLSSAISWLSLFVMIGGLVVCVSNQRFLPKIRWLSLGFAGLILAGIWNRVGIPFLTQAGIVRNGLGVLLFISSMVQLISMGLLVWGLSALLSDYRRRLSPKEEAFEELI